MRGAHATVAIDGGLSAELVAGTLGHEDSKTTKESYALEGVEEAAIRRKLFRLLEGGRKTLQNSAQGNDSDPPEFPTKLENRTSVDGK